MTATQTHAVERSAESLWRNGDFLKFWLGETLSLLGNQVTNLALPLTAIIAFDRE